jgi:hypothetical protein
MSPYKMKPDLMQIPPMLADARPCSPCMHLPHCCRPPPQLESLPLLQAYGLDGVGRSGFFTQCVKVGDVEASVEYAGSPPLVP